MGPSPKSAVARWSLALTLLALITALGMSAALAAPAAQAEPEPRKSESVAEVARVLAKDTGRLADARTELDEAQDEHATISKRQRKMRRQIEARLVSLYKYGNVSLLAQAASGGSVRDVGTSLDTLDVVAKHENKSVKTWTKLVKRNRELNVLCDELEREIVRSKKAVRKARIRLSKAEAAAAEARRAAERMAELKDSPVLPRVGHPETNVTRAADGDDDDALSAAEQPVGFTQSGVASVYHDNFTGELTANGERYDPNAFTAAHPSLPLGTWVTVNAPGGSISVRINDRGPYIGGRIIDLSRAAAQAVNLMGLAQVTISVQA